MGSIMSKNAGIQGDSGISLFSRSASKTSYPQRTCDYEVLDDSLKREAGIRDYEDERIRGRVWEVGRKLGKDNKRIK
ncbi:hypothetical protein ABE65_011575 [Fictibacillus phosphorivorans]|uniref:Uncharacterized protein n=1 Tax=Fictibacillus phosphorivorans TaxID=1221500 RepID=A0A160IN02_9BACL|nr:hypothetical protein ABE65_011575 [Fictibacillus phosphorivorans]